MPNSVMRKLQMECAIIRRGYLDQINAQRECKYLYVYGAISASSAIIIELLVIWLSPIMYS